MPHTHRWRVTAYVQLTLPTVTGYAERCITWTCVGCGLPSDLTGEVRLETPRQTPDAWRAQAQAEQRRGGPLAREAHRQQEGLR